MKKFLHMPQGLFLLLALLAPWAANAQTGNISFADSNVKQICVQNWDTNSDGELSYNEAAAVTTLNPSGATNSSAFSFNSNITSFNELQYFTGLTTIVRFAFQHCTNLTSITLPNSVTSIEIRAFLGCESLASIAIPSSVTTIGDSNTPNPFEGCKALSAITVDADNTVFDSRDNCNAIIKTNTNQLIAGCKNTIIPNTVTGIGKNAFYHISSLTSITIPSSVTTIGTNAFSSCTGLTSITALATTPPTCNGSGVFSSVPTDIPVYVPVGSISAYQTASIWSNFTNFVGYITFEDPAVEAICLQNWDTDQNGLLTLTEAAAVTSLGTVFQENYNITSFNELQYFTGVSAIEQSAFQNCIHLASITLPPFLSSIGYSAFYDCSALTSIVIPASVTSLEWTPFPFCTALESITMEAGPNNMYHCEGNAIIDINHTLVVGCKNTVIPDDVTAIGDEAFVGCTSLTAIDIPSSVTHFGIRAFSYCESLTSFTIPASVTSIDANAFTYCSGLTELTVLATTPPTLGTWVFGVNNFDIPVYVPCGSLEAYQAYENGSPWGGFTNFQCLPYDAYLYLDDFETSCDWQLINGDLTNQWVWGEAGTQNNHYLYISDDNGTSNHYTINSPAVVYAAKLFHFEEGWYRFQYDWLAYGENTYDYLRVALVPASVELTASSTKPSDFSYNTLPEGWIALDGGAQLNQNTWWQTIISEIEVPTGDYLMVFAWRNDNSVGTQPPAAIDNVSITPITCLAPAELTAQHVGATQVILDWTPSGNEDEWRVWLSWENGNETLYVPYTADTHPFTLTGLTAGRTYTANVYAVCGPDDASMPSNEISFTTSTNPCDDPISLPFTENFDGYTGSTSPSVNVLPDCWSRINTTTASYYSGYPRVTEFSSYAHSGPNFLYFMSNYDSDPQDQYAILPPVDHTANLVLSLYARIPAAGRNGTFMVGVMTDPSDASTFTELASYQPTSTTYTYYSIPLGLYTGDGTYIAIKMPAASSEVNYRGVCIDDIAIEPLCNPEDQCNLTFTLTDSYGDGWNGNAINVVDVETGVILASMTNVTNDHANAPITETYTLPVCDGRELRFEWVMGNQPSYPDECSYTITDVNGTVIVQGTGNSNMNTGDVLGTYLVSCTPVYSFLTDGNWNDGSHWNTGEVPPAGSDVVIQANVTVPAGYLAVANAVSLDGGSITVADGGQLKHNTLDLMVTMKKNIAGYDDANSQNNYYLLAVPFLSVQVPTAMTANPGSDFYRFDPSETGAEWRNHKEEPITFVQRRYGYLYANPESVELSLTGITLSVSNEFTMSYTVDYTEGSSNPSNGWALLGNPFTYNAYVYRFDSNNEFVPMPIMMYDEEGELQTIYGGPVAPMQGFFVHVTETTTVYFSGTGLHEDDYVDLGLPSGTLWATCNVGASSPEDYGDYFAWGETEPKDTYNWSTYQHCNGSYYMTKYCNDASYGYNGFTDNLTTLLPEDDAATANWGGNWRMPTQEEWQELLDNTTVTWTTQNGVNGRLFTSANGNSLFLPAAGGRLNSSLYYAGYDGYYWSSSLYTGSPDGAWGLGFGSDSYYVGYDYRNYGQSVRPVRSGVPEGAINGKFSINEEGKQVYFSQGNLQYIGSAATPYWKFADNQWDCLSITTGQNSANQDVDRDLFGWGTSGYDHGAVCYQPWSTSQTYSDYYAYQDDTYTAYDLNEQTGMADWGYNAISNGGNQTNQWRTLTEDEWMYVFNTRSTASGIRYARATVNDVKGVILLPDNWSSSIYSLNNTNTANANFSSNTISASQWTTLENAGAVFLPTAGYRDGTTVYHVGSRGYYWSATSYNNISAYDLDFSNQNFFANGYYSRSYGFSVRVVCDAK